MVAESSVNTMNPFSRKSKLFCWCGTSLIVEVVGGQQRVYLDTNDGVTGFGIMTNEPTFDWHLENIKHYQWKRTLARQAVSVPGNFYPDER